MAKLPMGYTELKYIQGQGGQYINTGLYANGVSTKIVADVEIIYNVSSWTMLIGSYGDNNQFSWWTNGTKIYAYYDLKSMWKDGITERTTLIADGNTWSFGDEVLSFAQRNFTSDKTVYLFSVNGGGNNFPSANMRLYSCQIYDNDTLLRDYVPCYNDTDDIGLYDLVEQKFYGNDGSGSFIPGREIKTLSMYVKVDGRWKSVENMVIS